MVLHVRGVVLPEDRTRDIYLVGDRVTFEPVSGAETIADSGYVLPGLVDAHCHIGIAHGEKPVGSVAEAKELALVNRDAGVLALRDAGSPFPYPQLDDDQQMPRLARAGRHLAPPKKHLRGIPLECAADQVVAATAEQAKAGNGWVKLVADWLDRGAKDLAPCYDEATTRAVIETAHAAGSRIAAHTFDEETVAMLVRAGVDSVEHGTGMSPDVVDEMARRGTVLVPTMINIARFPDIAVQADPKFPGYAEHMRTLHRRFPTVVRAAYEAGVPIRVGTDAGGSIGHGVIAEEMLLLHQQIGMSAADILEAASWGAREWLGFPGLVEGGLADLVIYPEDPRQDLRVVREPSQIVLRGQVVR
ncbi:MAG TPA: amidohydrolase family protein [Micromonosporaceae bacterium]|nr:amidohydrolase family protein [Micromonosporaceae bacterium]